MEERMDFDHLTLASASVDVSSRFKCHVVAIPYPGRGHVNSMVNTCRCLAAYEPEGLLITLVATEEWLAILALEPPLPSNIQLRSIPNVLPSETTRSNDFPGFFQAVLTKMEVPVARRLDELAKPVGFIVADTMLSWVVQLGMQRSIPVVSLWPMSSALLLSIFDRWDLPPTGDDHHYPIDVKDYWLLRRALEKVEALSGVPKADCLLIASFQELELHATNSLKDRLKLPVYTVGPSIPYIAFHDRSSTEPIGPCNLDYLKWLDSKPKDSALYVSLGSHWAVSGAQMNEIAAGLRESGAYFLLSARANSLHLQQVCGDRGLVVPWCDQLRVLCHPSTGAFFTHCGWNSTMESVFAGVIMLTFPLAADQPTNAKLIVEDWKVGVRVRREGSEEVVKSVEISGAIKRVMDLEGNEGKEMRSRAKNLEEACERAVELGGSSNSNIKAFVKHVLCGRDIDGRMLQNSEVSQH